MADAVDPNVWPALCSGMTDSKKPEAAKWYHSWWRDDVLSYKLPAIIIVTFWFFGWHLDP